MSSRRRSSGSSCGRARMSDCSASTSCSASSLLLRACRSRRAPPASCAASASAIASSLSCSARTERSDALSSSRCTASASSARCLSKRAIASTEARRPSSTPLESAFSLASKRVRSGSAAASRICSSRSARSESRASSSAAPTWRSRRRSVTSEATLCSCASMRWLAPPSDSDSGRISSRSARTRSCSSMRAISACAGISFSCSRNPSTRVHRSSGETKRPTMPSMRPMRPRISDWCWRISLLPCRISAKTGGSSSVSPRRSVRSAMRSCNSARRLPAMLRAALNVVSSSPMRERISSTAPETERPSRPSSSMCRRRARSSWRTGSMLLVSAS